MASDTKVNQPVVSGPIADNVVRLDVPVNNPGLFGLYQGLQRVQAQLENTPAIQSAAIKAFAHRLTHNSPLPKPEASS